MAYEQKDMTGVLFKSTERRSERSPAMWGRITIRGVKYKLAGWKQDGAGGKPAFLSLKATLEGEEPRDDDIPF